MKTNRYRLGKGGLEQMEPATLEVGQIVWLNGYGQDKHYHERQAIYKIDPDRGFGITYHTVNLDTYRTQRHDACIRPDSEIFGIGIYYTPGDMASQADIDAALARVAEVEAEDKRRAEQKAAEAHALADATIKQWGGKLERVKEGDYSSWQLAGRNIRRELKEHFPGHKFSVRGKSFSGGNAITVSWTDGPTVKEVEEITMKYQEGHFDGMQDLYEYSHRPFTGLFGGTKYIHNERVHSEAFKSAYRDQACGADKYEKERALYRILAEVSKYEKPVPAKTITQASPVDGVTVTINDEKNGVEIRFPGKPDNDILVGLKERGFRWHRKLKFWYAKQDDERLEFANSLAI